MANLGHSATACTGFPDMLRSINSLPDDHNGHLRNLIDQRNVRADVHGRLSAAVSDFPDTPSVYSHSYFSPRPSESDSRAGYAHSSSTSNVDNGRYEPHTSILDLTNNRRSSYVSQDYDNADSTSSSEVTDESETTARMSYLGPKMRVHSRAPWEEEALEEVDEENVSGGSSFLRRHAAKSITSAFSSPRPSFTSSVDQQSEDSSISQPATKRSFETINSQVSLPHTRGGLYSLAQESTSSNSLGRPTPVKDTFLHTLSIGRLRSETLPATNVPNTPLIPSPMSSSPSNLIPTSASRQASSDKPNIGSPSSSYDSLEFLSARKASTHPYANPELVVSYPEGVQNATAPPDTRYTPHCDSEANVMEPYPMGPKAKYNALAKISIPDSSANYVGSKVRNSPINTRNISSPVAAIFSPQNLRAERLPGWTERPSAAAFSLISLEEASKRLRNSTDTAAATLSSSDSGTSFPANRADYPTSSSSPLADLGSRARGRSISAGANAKNALHNILGQPRSDSDPVFKEDFIPVPLSGRTLKNKKSGFLKIFNRDKDLQSVPPVPSIQSQPSQRLATANIHRVPVPSLSQPEAPISQKYGSSLPADMNKNMKRSSPSLSINATTQGFPTRATVAVPSAEPQSAPPDVPEFPTLKLRPVSMLFSASFGDLVPSDLHETTGQETPRSCTPPSRSPRTTPRPLDDFTSINDKNPKALQDQMLSAKSTWQRHILELEGQVHDLKAELEQLKNNEYCDKCGRGKNPPRDSAGMINRPRARTGISSRTVYHRT